MNAQSIRIVSVAFALFAPPTSIAHAQFEALQPGVRVRLHAPSEIEGRVTSRDRDAVHIVTADSTLFSFSFSAIETAEISRGTSRGEGALIGGLLGAGVGLFVASALSHEDSPRCTKDTDPNCAVGDYVLPSYSGLAGSMMAVLLSPAIGAGIGYAIGREHWEKVQPMLRTALGRGKRGTAIALSVMF